MKIVVYGGPNNPWEWYVWDPKYTNIDEYTYNVTEEEYEELQHLTNKYYEYQDLLGSFARRH